MKNHEKQPGTMKNQPDTMKNHEKQPGTMKNNEKQPGTMKNKPGEKVLIFRCLRRVTTYLHDTE